MSNILPRQKLSKSQKTKDWGKTVIDDLERLSNTTEYNGRSSNIKKQVSYDLMNGKLNKSDFEYVLKPYGKDLGAYPANLQHYDIISPKIQLLLGEELKRPFNFSVVTINEGAISELQDQKKEMVVEYIQSKVDAYYQEHRARLEGQAQEQGVPRDRLQEFVDQEIDKVAKPRTLQQLEKYFETDYRSMREITGQRLLDYTILEQHVKEKFNLLFKDGLVAGEELYYAGVVSGKPILRVCNPLDMTIIADPDSQWVEDAIAVIEERWLHPATILDELHDDLSSKQIDDIERLGGGGDITGKDFQYHYEEFRIKSEDEYRRSTQVAHTRGTDGTIRVLHCEWKSMRKIGFLSFGENEEIVGEEFRIPEHAVKGKDGSYIWMDDETETQFSLYWDWVSEVWEGTKVGHDIYVNVRPKTNQRRSLDNVSICKLGYGGYIHNSRNSESVSLVDRMKSYQYLYDIIYYRTELAFAKNKGRIMLMDLAQIPASQGWDVETWLYYMETMNMAFINSFESNAKGERASFNQFTEIDLSMGNYINQHVMMLDKIEDKMGELSGVSKQRQGTIASSELVGTTERAVVQSSHVTETYFYFHDKVKERALSALLDCARIAYANGTKINYITEDMDRIVLSFGENELSETEYGVFVMNSDRTARIRAFAEEMAMNSYRSGAASGVEALSMIQHTSIAEMKRDLGVLEAKRKEFEQSMSQQQQEAQAQMMKEERDFQMLLDDRETERNIQDNETKLTIAEIQAESKMEVANMQGENNDRSERVKERIEEGKRRVESWKQSRNEELERLKLKTQKEVKEKEIEVKRQQANKPKPSTSK